MVTLSLRSRRTCRSPWHSCAGAPHDLPASVTLPARAANLEEALLVDHLAASVAHRASDQAVALFGARSLASRALIEPWDLDLDAQPAQRILERDFEVVAQIFASMSARAAASPATSAEQIAEAKQVAQNIAEVGERGRIEALVGAESLESLMAVAIVGGALLGIAEHAVRFGGFLEFFLGVLIVGVAVRMVFEREFAVGALEARVVDVATHAQNFVVIALGSVHFFFTATFTMAGRSRRPRKL